MTMTMKIRSRLMVSENECDVATTRFAHANLLGHPMANAFRMIFRGNTHR